ERVNAVVQWYQASQPGIWRYKIEKGKMVLDECNGQDIDGCSAADLTDAVGWAVKKYPAKRYALILWDHGLGIVDPIWRPNHSFGKNGAHRFIVDPNIVKQHPRIQIDGLTMDGIVSFTKPIEAAAMASDRGILFNERTKTYMDSKTLSQALNVIKTKILGNRKIDLLGMDACLMAMVEVGYLARNCAKCLVSSQEIELAYGWNYTNLLQHFSTENNETHVVACNIVNSYAAYYGDKTQFFTQSALNLELIDQLKNAIDAVILLCKQCKTLVGPAISGIIKQARCNCLQLSASHYIDLYSFLSEFSRGLNVLPAQGGRGPFAVQQLKNAIESCQNVIGRVVIA
ncbi:MAG: clostripain-related cysteine peptidase, partial [Pseudomonadota bacterium]